MTVNEEEEKEDTVTGMRSESTPDGLLSKMRKGGLLSLGHFDKRFPAIEPYVYFGIGMLVSLIVTINGVIKLGDMSVGDIFYQQSIAWIVLAVLGVLTYVGLGFRD